MKDETELVLYAPDGFRELKEDEKKEICNGCGAKNGFPVPDSFYFLDISMACNIHDFMYHSGKTLEDKEVADRVFKNNLFRIVEWESCCWLLKKLRLRRAKTYYYFVKEWGASAFWANKIRDNEKVVI